MSHLMSLRNETEVPSQNWFMYTVEPVLFYPVAQFYSILQHFKDIWGDINSLYFVLQKRKAEAGIQETEK